VALAELARTAVLIEPGVLALEAVNDKAHPTLVTVLEVYASEESYQAHLKTPQRICALCYRDQYGERGGKLAGTGHG